jgi:hypothetical protein
MVDVDYAPIETRMKYLITLISIVAALSATPMALAGRVQVHGAPAGEELSKDYTVQVEGQDVPVYSVKVAPADRALRFRAMDDKAHSADYFGEASFAYFDMEGPVAVKVTCPEPIQSAKVLPSSYKISPTIEGKSLTFTLKEPNPVTIEVNGSWVGALHLFANPPETNIPEPGDPKVIYYGPGIHEATHVVVTNNQTVYVAPGAIVRGIAGPDEPHRISSYNHLPNYSPTFQLEGNHIRLCGRGIIDFSLIPTATRNPILVEGNDIVVEGVIVRDSSTWTIPIRQSDWVTIRNVKLLGRRANSDGIDVCNSDHVTIENCFIRTLDDLIVVKTYEGETHHVVARDCVLWNEVAHALSIGAELRKNVDDVIFSNCDVIHDMGREWTLRIFHCDGSRISNVRFENLRIEESPRLISLWINQAQYSAGPERGHIDHVVFKNIQAAANPLRVDLQGFDQTHLVEDVLFDNVVANGKRLSREDIKTNAFVNHVSFLP